MVLSSLGRYSEMCGGRRRDVDVVEWVYLRQVASPLERKSPTITTSAASGSLAPRRRTQRLELSKSSACSGPASALRLA